jgi:DUF1365 family protein
MLHAFLSSALDGCERSASRFVPFNPRRFNLYSGHQFDSGDGKVGSRSSTLEELLVSQSRGLFVTGD